MARCLCGSRDAGTIAGGFVHTSGACFRGPYKVTPAEGVNRATCGCCSAGCVCVNHQDVRGQVGPARQCNLHCDEATFVQRWADARIAAQDADDAAAEGGE